MSSRTDSKHGVRSRTVQTCSWTLQCFIVKSSEIINLPFYMVGWPEMIDWLWSLNRSQVTDETAVWRRELDTEAIPHNFSTHRNAVIRSLRSRSQWHTDAEHTSMLLYLPLVPYERRSPERLMPASQRTHPRTASEQMTSSERRSACGGEAARLGSRPQLLNKLITMRLMGITCDDDDGERVSL